MLNFDFWWTGLGLASLTHFVYDLSRKILLLYSINCPNFITYLSIVLEILGCMCIEIISCPVCDVINFAIKVGLSPSKKYCFICFNDSPSKMMKNPFYFILKVLFVLKIFKPFSCFFGHVEKTTWLERKG